MCFGLSLCYTGIFVYYRYIQNGNGRKGREKKTVKKKIDSLLISLKLTSLIHSDSYMLIHFLFTISKDDPFLPLL